MTDTIGLSLKAQQFEIAPLTTTNANGEFFTIDVLLSTSCHHGGHAALCITLLAGIKTRIVL